MPDFFFIECANVFWKWVQRSDYPPQDAQEHLRDLTGLGLSAIPVQVLAGDALNIALQYKVTAYDACYVATADERLVRQIEKGKYDVQWLGELDLSPE